MSDPKESDTPVVIRDSVARAIFGIIQKEQLHEPQVHNFGSAVRFLTYHNKFSLDADEAHRKYFKLQGRVAALPYELVVNTTTGGQEFGGLDPTTSSADFKVRYFSKHKIQSADPRLVDYLKGHEDNLEMLLKGASSFGLPLEVLDRLLKEMGLPRTNMDKTRATYDLPRMILHGQGERRLPFPAALRLEVHEPKDRGIVEVSATYNPDFKSAAKINPKRSDTTRQVRLNLYAAMKRQPGT